MKVKQSNSTEAVNETRVLEGRLIVNEDRQSGYVEVKSEQLRSIITKYYMSAIVASQQNSTDFVNINEMFHFDTKPNYPIQVKQLFVFDYSFPDLILFDLVFTGIRSVLLYFLITNGSVIYPEIGY